MENRHCAGDLKQMQSLPLSAKITMTKNRIRQWYDAFNGDVYVSFSGGKDSTVLLHIARELYPDIEGVFCDTGLEYPEIRQFVKTFENVTWIRPKMNFRQVIKEYGYPVASKEVSKRIYELRHHNLTEKYRNELLYGGNGKERRKIPERWKPLLTAPFEVSSKCCDVMKKRPFHQYEKESGKKSIVATMANESSLRKSSWIRYGCNAFNANKPQSRPMSFWTEQDVLEYLITYNVPYCSVYGEIIKSGKEIENLFGCKVQELQTTGCERTGCMFCMYGCQTKGDRRFHLMKNTHPKQYEYCMKPWEEGGLGMDEVLNYINVEH